MRLWRWVAGSTMAVAIFFAPGLSLAEVPPPADRGSFNLPDPAATSGVWTTSALEVTTTAIGVSWQPGSDPGSVSVRASENGVDWGPWIELHTQVADHGPDSTTSEARRARPASDPVYVGHAEYVQFRGDGSKLIQVEWVETAGRRMGLLDRVLHFLDRLTWGGKNPVLALPDAPPMIPRAEWGGDACIGPEPHDLEYADRVQMMFVHHTNHGGDENGYSPSQVKELIYAICTYHVQVREFWDIGYNFLIDKYGTIYEGRRGGAESTVIGAHTGGFNSYSTGVAFIGDHQSITPTVAAQEAFRQLASWKLDVHHVDPNATVVLESLESTLYPKGQMVSFRTVSGHRDAASTTCPGNACYSLIDPLRAAVAPIGGPKIFGGWPDRPWVGGWPEVGYEPSTFGFRFTEPMQWTFSMQDQFGNLMHQLNGSGSEGVVIWDGTTDGLPVPIGRYLARLDAVPESGAAVPRPATFELRVGFNPPFRDDEGSLHEPDIVAVSEVGITRGCGPELYCPGGAVTRTQMALFLTRFHALTGYLPPSGEDQGFQDIAGLLPEYQIAINQLSQLGITRGTSPTTFDPEGTVTRWQMALFLTRLLVAEGLPLPDGADQGFVDIGHLPPEYQTAINQIRQLNVTSQIGQYQPDATLPRDQMASFLARSLNLVLPGVEQ